MVAIRSIKFKGKIQKIEIYIYICVYALDFKAVILMGWMYINTIDTS